MAGQTASQVLGFRINARGSSEATACRGRQEGEPRIVPSRSAIKKIGSQPSKWVQERVCVLWCVVCVCVCVCAEAAGPLLEKRREGKKK
jgi:hypothetical protein